MEVLGRVFILRTVATAYVPAAKTDSKMNPAVAGLQAFFTAVRVWRLVQSTCATCRHSTSIVFHRLLFLDRRENFRLFGRLDGKIYFNRSRPASIVRESARRAGRRRFDA